MKIEIAKRLVATIYDHPEVEKCYALGDLISKNQTKHDKSHGLEVHSLALRLVALVSQVSPDLFDEWTRDVVVPIAAYLHDIGRCINIDNHDGEGAKWAMKFLKQFTLPGDDETLDTETIKRIARIIAYHRASKYQKNVVQDPALDVVLIADKCVGDEERVRPGRAAALRLLTMLRATWIPLRKGGEHDRANFAIKNANVIRDDRKLVLEINMDRRVCQPSLIYGLYGERYHCCRIAARKLGLDFELDFNGARYVETQSGWSSM